VREQEPQPAHEDAHREADHAEEGVAAGEARAHDREHLG
jgi:hypothetical protein